MRTLDPVKHEEKRQELLGAAMRCFARDGFQGASISDICKEAHISRGHLYHYFESKEEMVVAITGAALARAAESFDRMLDSVDTVETLAAEIVFLKSRQEGQTSLFILHMLVEAARNPVIATITQGLSRQLRSSIAIFLRRGQALGQVDRTLDADQTAGLLMCVIDGSMSWEIRDPKINSADSAALLKTLIIRLLTPTAA
jgi:TetR/AcrR family transcriptional repressor of uid operon